jgi:hypothetical protein
VRLAGIVAGRVAHEEEEDDGDARSAVPTAAGKSLGEAKPSTTTMAAGIVTSNANATTENLMVEKPQRLFLNQINDNVYKCSFAL